MEIRNNMTLMSGFNQKADVNKNKVGVSFKAGIPVKEKDVSKLMDATIKAIDEVKDIAKLSEMATKATKRVSGIVKDTIPKQKPSKLFKFFEGLTGHVEKSKWFNKLAESGGGLDGLAYALVLGNAAKELMGTTIYTVQALTNEDLSPDKRKFVGMYDLAVGVMSTTLSLIAGVALVKGQRGLIKAIVGGDKAKALPGYAKAFAGLSFMIPIAVQTILIKRIIAPAIATPMAGTLKAKLEADEAAKKGDKKQNDNMSLVPSEALILAKTPANSETNHFKQKLVANA